MTPSGPGSSNSPAPPPSRSWIDLLRPMWPTLLLLALSLAVLANALFVDSRLGVGSFRYPHWLFDYRWEFVKRGLPGEVLRRLGMSRDPASINALGTALAAGLTVALTLLFGAQHRTGRDGTWLFALLAVTSPATIAHLGYDVGRFDQLLILLALAGLFSVQHGSRWAALAAVLTTTVVGILIHELYAVAFLPTVFGFWWYVDPGERDFNYARAGLCLALVGLTALVMSAGMVTGTDAAEYLTRLRQTHGPEGLSGPGPEASVRVLFSDLEGNISWTLERLYTAETLKHHAALIAVFTPTFVVFARLFRNLYAGAASMAARLRQTLLLLCCLSPLALYLVGVDFFRWWSLAFLNLFVVVSLVMRDPQKRTIVADTLRNRRYLVHAAVVVGLVFGPLQIEHSFGVAGHIWDGLRSTVGWLT